MPTMYCVLIQTFGSRPDIKVFSHRKDASNYASTQVNDGAHTADIYEINDAVDARTAKAALELGHGTFVEPHGRRATQTEIDDGTLYRKAAQAALWELVEDHNASVARGEPGLLKAFLGTPVPWPPRGRGSRSLIDSLVMKILQSPAMTERIDRHFHQFVTAARSGRDVEEANADFDQAQRNGPMRAS